MSNRRETSSRINFYKDWVEYLRLQMISSGYKIDPKTPDDEIEMMSFNLGKRRIRSCRRQVFIAKGFTCPEEHKEVLERIKETVQTGVPLTPYQSKAVLEKPSAKDGLLFDWDIHHLHLGKTMDSDGFVARTKDLLFVRVTNTAVFFLSVGSHGDWGEIELLEIIHRNWPETIVHQKMKELVIEPGGVAPTSDEIVKLRKGIYMLSVLSDGTAYSPPGGGIATSGDSVDAVSGMNNYRRWIRGLQKYAERRMNEYLVKARKKGWKPGKPIHVHLGFVDNEPYAVIPEYGLKFPLPKR